MTTGNGRCGWPSHGRFMCFIGPPGWTKRCAPTFGPTCTTAMKGSQQLSRRRRPVVTRRHERMWSPPRSHHRCLSILTSVLLSIWVSPTHLAAGDEYPSGRTSFAVKLNGELVPYQSFGIYVLPGGEVSLEVLTEGGMREVEITVPQASLTGGGPVSGPGGLPRSPVSTPKRSGPGPRQRPCD